MFEPVHVPRTPAVASAVRRYAVLVLTLFATCVVLAIAVTLAFPPRPIATSQMTLEDPRGNSVFRQSNLPPADLSAYTQGRASYAHSKPVLQRASQLLSGAVSERYLLHHTTTTIGANTSTVKILVRGGSRSEAIAQADAIVEAYQSLSEEQTTADAATALKSLDASRATAVQASAGDPTSTTAAGRSAASTLADIDQRSSEIRLNAALFNDGVSYVQPADAAQGGSSGNALKNIAAGMLIGLLLGVAAAVALASRQRPLEDAEEPRDIVGAPLIGELTSGRAGPQPAQYDVISAALVAAMPRGTIALTDCRTGQRSTGVAANIALALATDGARVGLLDAGGTGRQSLADALGVHTEPGEPSNELHLADGLVEVATADPRRTSEVLAVLADMHSRCDLVVLLSPSVQEPGAARILKASDSVLVLVPVGELSSRLTRLRQVLNLLDVPVLGYVFTRGRIGVLEDLALSARTAVHRS